MAAQAAPAVLLGLRYLFRRQAAHLLWVVCAGILARVQAAAAAAARRADIMAAALRGTQEMAETRLSLDLLRGQAAVLLAGLGRILRAAVSAFLAKGQTELLAAKAGQAARQA